METALDAVTTPPGDGQQPKLRSRILNNTFVIPIGGNYVSRGLLALVNREDELAHEIARVTDRHL